MFLHARYILGMYFLMCTYVKLVWLVYIYDILTVCTLHKNGTRAVTDRFTNFEFLGRFDSWQQDSVTTHSRTQSPIWDFLVDSNCFWSLKSDLLIRHEEAAVYKSFSSEKTLMRTCPHQKRRPFKELSKKLKNITGQLMPSGKHPTFLEPTWIRNWSCNAEVLPWL